MGLPADHLVSRGTVAQSVEGTGHPLSSDPMTTTLSLPAHRRVSPATVLVRLGVITTALLGVMMF